jgi:hypothetical protein
MDDLLTSRYAALFRGYGTGSHPIVLDVKNHINGILEKHPGFLRIDAAHFLLVNADHMVFRALAGYIPALDPRFNQPIDVSFSEDHLRTLVMECLQIILRDLDGQADKPATAHAVLLSLDRTWSEIGAKLTWA